eukprot:15458108-Alexandrium_andersonii.AAC.1
MPSDRRESSAPVPSRPMPPSTPPPPALLEAACRNTALQTAPKAPRTRSGGVAVPPPPPPPLKAPAQPAVLASRRDS